MNASSQYLTVSMETWINCENLLLSLTQKQTTFSGRTLQVLDECANVCLGTVQALKDGWQNISEVALLCVGLCEECAEVCERYTDDQFQQCAQICRRCSSSLSQLASKAA